MYGVGFSDILDASKRLAGIVERTPVVNSEEIDRLAGRRVLIKCENIQYVGAFKFRGASNVLEIIGDGARNGVCTHSSGNHAQAVALAAKNKQVPAYIVMPENAPRVKVRGVESHGAEITFCEPNLNSRIEAANRILEKTGSYFIHPFDDPDVIAGQGTVALEMIQECGQIDAFMAPIGGGGLMSGTCLSVRHHFPGALIFGAEPEGADDASLSLKSGEFVPQTDPDTICDGLLTSMGKVTWPIIRDHVDDIVTVSDEEVLQAMALLYRSLGMIVEPSGAICLAAVLKEEFKSVSGIESIGIILSGGNVDRENLPFDT